MHVLLRLKSVLLFFTLHLNLIIVASAGMGLRTKRGNPLATIIECDPPFPHFPGDDYDLSRYSSMLELCASRRLRYILGYK